MSLRPRTVRRLMVLLAVVLVLVGTGAALYWHNESKKTAKLAEARRSGLAAYKAGDYRAALDWLKVYVARNKNDAEALYAYAISRSRIEEPNARNIFEGITALGALVQLDPKNLDAKHSLLDLYSQVAYSNEAIDLADKLLDEHPDDVAALKARCTALARLRRYEEALGVSQRINDLAPGDLDQQFETYRLMAILKRTPADMLARAQKQQKAHDDDPRFMMILGMAYGNAGDVATGRQWLNRATTRPSPDATFVRHMVGVLDSLRMYNQAQELLDRSVAANPDPQVMRVLVQRLWQSGKLKDVIERLKNLDAASPASDSALLSYRALALFDTGKADEAKQIAAALGKRSDDSESLAWSTALSTRFGSGGSDPKSALAQYQSALSRTPDNAVIRNFVGECYARLGETDVAVGAWHRAADLAPSWAGPRMNAARALLADGRVKDALTEADAGYRAAPDNSAAIILLSGVRFRALEMKLIDPSLEPNLLAAVEQIQKMAPGEAETLPAYVSLLARAGRRDDALAAARNAIENSKKYDQGTILRLLNASRTYKLGLEDDLKSAGVAGSDSPRMVLARAADLAASGKPKDGLDLIESHARSATTRPTQWQLALVQYKEMIHDPSAAKDWMALGDANENDLSVQSAILKNGNSVRGDRDFIARTIDRLKTLTGAEGQTWKLERARWLLGGESSKDAAEAVNILTGILAISPNLTEARLLLADAYEMVGNSPAAIKALQDSAAQEPNNASIAIELARTLQEQNRFADARTYLERAAAAVKDLGPETRRRIAGMLAAQGDMDRAVKVLEADRNALDSTGELLLAEFYRRLGRTNDAEAIYVKRLSNPPLTLDTIRAAADFYGAQGNLEQAQKALERIPETKPRPGAAEMTLAGFNERYVSPDSARKYFIAATTAAPASPQAWRQLAAYHLRGGRYDEALRAADDGLKNLPDDAGLKRLRAVATSAAQMLAANPSWRGVLGVLASAAPEDRGASEFLASAESPASRPTADTLPTRLTEVAAKYPRSLPLRTALVQWHVSRREFGDAASVAQQTMDAFPNDAESARVTATVYRAAGHWEQAASAAQKWRDRNPQNPAAADLMLADIRLSQGDPAAALKVLAPYTQPLLASRGDTAIATIYLRAQAQLGKEADAKAFLQPLLSRAGDDGKIWRSIWMQVAGSDIKNVLTAAEWLREVKPAIAPANDRGEAIELARAWYTLAGRNRAALDEGALDEAVKLLDPIVREPSALVTAVLLRGAVADRGGDVKTAEDCYRRGLIAAPDQPDALNNLAYLVLLRGGDLDEALKLITRAVELAPGTSNFYDTLARVQVKRGDRAAALGSFERALKLEPNNLEALIGMATTFCDAGKRDAAVALLAQIDTIMKNKPTMSPQTRKELDALRTTMKASL